MKIFKTTAFIIGSIIGAGFASGKEIFEYFAKYGICSLFFVIPLFFFMYFFFFFFLRFGKKIEDTQLKTTNQALCKNWKLFNKTFNPFNLILFFTFLILSSAMFSGLVALFETYFPNGSKFIYFLIAIIITIFLLSCSFKVFEKISNIIVPLIIICIILNVICSLSSGNFVTNFGITNILPLPFLSLAYASQNAFFASFVITKLGKNLNINESKKVSFFVAGIICLLIILGILCFLFNPKLAYSEMPFAEVAIAINPIFSVIYAIILFGSIITTYATSITSLKEYFKSKKKYSNTILMLMFVVLLSLLDFGKIIGYLYPLIGAFGILYLYKIYTYDKKNTLNFNKQAKNLK